MTLELAQACAPHVRSIVNGSDFVPSMDENKLEDLRREVWPWPLSSACPAHNAHGHTMLPEPRLLADSAPRDSHFKLTIKYYVPL